MMKRSLAVSMLIAAVALSACGGSKSAETKASGSATESSAETKAGETKAAAGETKAEETKAEAKAPGEDAGFEEFPIGDDQEVGPLIISGVYFQPVDMEPAGNSLSKADSDCHIEADITASQEGTTLGYGKGDFVPWLQVKAIIQKKGSDKEPTEVAFMPMNASDGPHYGDTFYLSKKILLIMRASGEVQSFSIIKEFVPFLSIFLEDDAHQCCHRKTLLPINKVIAVVRYT